ncbi:hypothetical protein V8F06_014602 [Rhypophila decipiens]
MNMSFGSMEAWPVSIHHRCREARRRGRASRGVGNHGKEFEDSLLGVVQRIQNEYEKHLAENPDNLVEMRITPSLPNDTPVLKLPAGAKLSI